MKNMKTKIRIAKVCNIIGFGRRINGFNLRINQNHAHQKIVGIILLSALLLLIPTSVYPALTTSITISSTGTISGTSTPTPTPSPSPTPTSSPSENIFTVSVSGSTYTYTSNTGVKTTSKTSADGLINDAINAASALPSGIVDIDAGNYLIDASIVPLSNCEVNCSSGVTIYQNIPASLSASVSLVLTTSSVSNFIWNGGTLNGNKGSLSDFRGTSTWGTNFDDYFGMGIYGGTNTGITIENVVIENVIGQGIDLWDTSNGLVNGCTVTNAGDNPITIDTDSNNCTVEYCTVTGGQDVGINVFQGSNCTLDYNTVSDITEYSGASHWGMAAEQSDNINMIGNTINNCDQDMAITYPATNTNVEDNVFLGTNGLSDTATPTTNDFIAFNNFSATTVSGVYFPDSTNVTYQGNIGLDGFQTLNITSDGNGNVAESDGTQGLSSAIGNLWQFPTGDVVKVTAEPNTGYVFGSWSLNGVVSSSNPISITMNNAESLALTDKLGTSPSPTPSPTPTPTATPTPTPKPTPKKTALIL